MNKINAANGYIYYDPIKDTLIDVLDYFIYINGQEVYALGDELAIYSLYPNELFYIGEID